jgi:tetratricopeptide (TPR) repeat protein
LADFSKVIELNPDAAEACKPDLEDAYNGRGIAKYNKADYDGALEDFNEVIELRTDYPEVYCNRGNVEYCKGDMDGALTDYNRAIEINPSDAVAYENRGNVENSRSDFDGALGDYNKAIELKPDFADAIKSRDELKAKHQEATPEPSLAAIKALFQDKLNGDLPVKDEQGFSHDVSAAQYFFDCIHPIGTAKSITVTDAVLNKDENGNIQSVGLRLELNWQGPLQSGSTIFQTLYDNLTDQFVNLNVIRTDGITRQNINDFANGYIIGAQIHDALTGN